MQWITAQQLDNWSRGAVARMRFPALVAGLIRASVPDISAFRFPSGATGDVRGWDGHVVSSMAASRVSEGGSYWELKTGDNAYADGLVEFDNRSTITPTDEKARTTYNFVTSRVWNNPARRPEDWVQTCRDRNQGWKNIQCLDAIALEDWLLQSPAVAARFARDELKVMPPRGARSTDQFWDEFRGTFDPALVEEVLLASRSDKAKDLVQALQRGSGITQYISDSQDEVIAFGVAAIRSASVEVKEWLEARTMIVDEIEAGRELLNVGHQLVFFLRGKAAISAGQFATRGSTLVPLGRQQIGGTAPYLERPTLEALAEALQKMDFNPALERQTAMVLARDCGRSIVALQRLKPSGHAELPIWTTNAVTLLPALLAGGWDANNNKDRAIIAKLADCANYYDFEGKLRPYVDVDDPPLDKSGNIWAVRAPRDAFLRVGKLMGPEVLTRLRAVVTDVFGHVPPPPDPKAVIRLDRTDADGFSEWLRDGLANTLLQIAVWDRMARMPVPEGGGQNYANDVVASIPGLGADERVLIALSSQLPYLAEAAPIPLLVALEHMLGGNSDALRRVFKETEGFLHPVSYHTGLLWALETIAWDPTFFERAVLLLARLDDLDPGGRLTNRPINSLGEIFLPWHPSTEAGPALRLAALDRITETLPKTGWKAITKMMPTMHGVATGGARPKLREVGSGEITVTYEDYWAMQSAVIRRAIAMAGLDPLRWHTIVAGITKYAPDDRNFAVKAIADSLPQLSDTDRKSVWEDLLKEVEKHERFPDAKWALPADQIAPLRAIVDQYAPQDPIEQTRLLFDSWSFDAKGNREPAATERRARLSDLLNISGPPAIAALASQVQNSYEIIDALGHINISADLLEAIANLSVTTEPTSFSVGLLSTLANSFGVERARQWLEAARRSYALTDSAVARFCQGFGDSRETWAFVASLGPNIESAYWSTKGPLWLKDKDEMLEAIAQYLHYGRGIAALEACLQQLGDVPTAALFSILETIVRELNTGSQRDGTMVSYETQQAFKELNRRDDVSVDDIARHEISMFPLLEHSGYRMRLYEVLASNPTLYFDVIKHVFRADDEPEPKEELSEQRQATWRLNYSILSNFHTIPGQSAEGIDGDKLTSWIDNVRQLAVDNKRVCLTDQYIGHVLAHSPNGSDGIWPAEVIRDQLERIRSDELEHGMIIEKFNMRGAHFRDMYGGGTQERAFAAQYHDFADKAATWPRTQAMLKQMARNWEADARREDEWAEQRKMKI